MPEKINLTIMLMAYNEQDNIGEAIDRAHVFASRIADKFEILALYAEASIDKTEDVIKDKMQQYPEVKIIYRPKERTGYGYGLKLGIENAQYDYIFFTDGDNQFDIKEMESFLRYLKDYDIVHGRRINRQDPAQRKIYSFIYNIGIDLLFFINFIDVDCAFKLCKKKVFDGVPLHSDSGFMVAEILIKAKKNGFRIKTLPVTHYPRTKGKSVTEGSIFYRSTIIKDLLFDMLKIKRDFLLLGSKSIKNRKL